MFRFDRMIKNIQKQATKLYNEDISGTTLDENPGFPAFRKRHPEFAKFLDYATGVMRFVLYWIGTGLIGFVAPLAALVLFAVYFKPIVAHGITADIGMALTAIGCVVILAVWSMPYFIAEGSTNTPGD